MSETAHLKAPSDLPDEKQVLIYRFVNYDRLSAIAAVSLTFLAAQELFATDGVTPIGVSPKARMRGGADVAVGDSALSQIDNPGSLSLQPTDRRQFDTSIQLDFPKTDWQGPLGSATSEIKLVPMADFGLSLPIDSDWTGGVAVHSKAGLASRFHIRPLLMPFMERRLGSDCKNLATYFNLSRRVNDRLTIGAGGRVEMLCSRFDAVFGPADVSVSRSTAFGGGFQAGATYKLSDDLTYGLSYTSPTWMTDSRGAEAHVGLLGIIPIELGDVSLTRLRQPQRVATGLAWRPTDRLMLTGEVRWINYSNSGWNSLTLKSEELPLGIALPMGYRDQSAFMLGSEYKLTEHWILAGGYHYAPSPVSDKNLFPMGSVISEHHATVGLRYQRDRWWVGVGYEMAFPNTLRGGGRSAIPLGIDYALSNLRQYQQSLLVGFGFSF